MAFLANSKIDLRVLAERLEHAKTAGARGVSFEGLAVREMSSVLQTSLRFDEEVPEFERHRIIHAAIFRAGERGTVTKDTLLPAISKLEQEYLRRPCDRFTVVTTLTVAFQNILRPVRRRDAIVRFFQRTPRRYHRRPEHSTPPWPPSFDPENHTVVTIGVSARDPHAAYEKAMATLNRIRAPWNYILNYKIGTTLFPSEPRPVSKIRVGPYQTVHDRTGKLALQSYWFEPLYQEFGVYDLRREWPALQRAVAAFKKWLSRHPYLADIENAVLRYTRALDLAHFDVVFLELWGVLELLTNTVGGSYADTIRRTLFLFKECDANRLILEHLRGYRNAIVHHGASKPEAEAFTYQLKRYVEELISYHLVWRGRFKSIAEFGDYLDLPASTEILSRQLRWYRAALRFRGA